MDWLRRFMFGRYGMDALSMALFLLFIILSFIARITHLSIIYWISYALILIAYFRIFSRNINKRYQENMRFLTFWNPVKGWIIAKYTRLKDYKYHKYLKCPTCSATLRVPRGRGKICVTCPKCRNEFQTKS